MASLVNRRTTVNDVLRTPQALPATDGGAPPDQPMPVRGEAMTRATVKDDATAILRHWREAVPDDRLAHLVKDASRVLNRALQLRLAGHGISFGHWTFLRVLWEQDGITQRELSDAVGVMEPTTHAALNAMERLGLIVRRQLPGDRRNLHIFLTQRARGLKRELVPHAIAVNEAAARGMPARDIATARRVLLGIIENMAAADLPDAPPQAARRRKPAPARRAARRTEKK